MPLPFPASHRLHAAAAAVRTLGLERIRALGTEPAGWPYAERTSWHSPLQVAAPRAPASVDGTPEARGNSSRAHEAWMLWDALCTEETQAQIRALPLSWEETRRATLLLVPATSSTATRSQWDAWAVSIGLRRHPLVLSTITYEALESEERPACLVYEWLPPDVLARHPIAALKVERDLHMDMTREAGRRSDAHLSRYQLASLLVSPGDTVLDAACGLGYGSALLWDASAAGTVVGIDLAEGSVAYARDNFGPGRPGVFFRSGDACDLSFLGDGTVGLVASFETMEHLPDPAQFVAEVARVLRPGGHFIASIPNAWVDEHGVDPNPFHEHVFDFARLRDLVGARLCVSHMLAQTAGGGVKLTDAPRAWKEVPLSGPPSGFDAEWWVVVARKEGSPSTPRCPPPEQLRPAVRQRVLAALTPGLPPLPPAATPVAPVAPPPPASSGLSSSDTAALLAELKRKDAIIEKLNRRLTR